MYKITVVNILIQKIYKRLSYLSHVYHNYHILRTKLVLYKDIHSTAFTGVQEFPIYFFSMKKINDLIQTFTFIISNLAITELGDQSASTQMHK